MAFVLVPGTELLMSWGRWKLLPTIFELMLMRQLLVGPLNSFRMGSGMTYPWLDLRIFSLTPQPLEKGERLEMEFKGRWLTSSCWPNGTSIKIPKNEVWGASRLVNTSECYSSGAPREHMIILYLLSYSCPMHLFSWALLRYILCNKPVNSKKKLSSWVLWVVRVSCQTWRNPCIFISWAEGK